METSSLVFGATSFLSNLITLLMLVVAGFYFAKKRDTGTLLMVLGLMLVFINSVSSVFIHMFLGRSGSMDGYMQYSMISAVLGALFYALFGIGLILHMLKGLRKSS